MKSFQYTGFPANPFFEKYPSVAFPQIYHDIALKQSFPCDRAKAQVLQFENEMERMSSKDSNYKTALQPKYNRWTSIAESQDISPTKGGRIAHKLMLNYPVKTPEKDLKVNEFISEIKSDTRISPMKRKMLFDNAKLKLNPQKIIRQSVEGNSSLKPNGWMASTPGAVSELSSINPIKPVTENIVPVKSVSTPCLPTNSVHFQQEVNKNLHSDSKSNIDNGEKIVKNPAGNFDKEKAIQIDASVKINVDSEKNTLPSTERTKIPVLKIKTKYEIVSMQNLNLMKSQEVSNCEAVENQPMLEGKLLCKSSDADKSKKICTFKVPKAIPCEVINHAKSSVIINCKDNELTSIPDHIPPKAANDVQIANTDGSFKNINSKPKKSEFEMLQAAKNFNIQKILSGLVAVEQDDDLASIEVLRKIHSEIQMWLIHFNPSNMTQISQEIFNNMKFLDERASEIVTFRKQKMYKLMMKKKDALCTQIRSLGTFQAEVDAHEARTISFQVPSSSYMSDQIVTVQGTQTVAEILNHL